MSVLSKIILQWPRPDDFVEQVKRFIENGGDPNETDNLGYTALTHINRVKPVALYLITQGADVNKMNRRGRGPLHYAAHESDAAFAKLLLENGADPNLADESFSGETPLMTSCLKFEDMNPVAELLIEYGADVNRKNMDGATALHIAVRSSNLSLYELLVKHGADVEALDARGKKADDYWDNEDD